MAARHLAIVLLAGLAALAAASGCGPPQALPRDPADVPGYLGTPTDLAGVDPSPLRGRRILVDPGHGGAFRGARGDGGLSEAEVNLGVALYLQGLLQWAGAEVRLTRTADVDFLTLADSSLAADLAARVALCDSLDPEVFVSIHHNSTAQRDPDINETQTYYPLGREGADLDLARAIHRQLVRALAIEPAKILPGGFHVLRHAPVPAVLGEPAMISNPVIEGRLSLARSLELEAGAYFLGLRDYFAAGTPHWATDLPDTLTVLAAGQGVNWRFDPGGPHAPRLDPATVRVTVDGAPVAHHLSPDGQTVGLQPRALRGGRELAVHGRNLAGRAAPARTHLRTAVDEGRWHCRFLAEEASLPCRGLLTYDHEAAPLVSFGPLLLSTRERPLAGIPLPTYPGRRGWLLLDPAPADLLERRIVAPDGPDAGDPFDDTGPTLAVLPAGSRWVHLDAPRTWWPQTAVPGGRWRMRLPLAPVPADVGDPRWPAVTVRATETLWLEADGALPLFLAGAAGAVSADTADSPRDTLAWRPLLPALIDRRVAIDPRGGGTDDQGLGPLGSRGSELNLQVAERLAALLRGAGCEVALLREGEIFTPDPERVRRADRLAADLYLAIGRGAPEVRHHHGSAVGAPWARSCAAALAPLLPDTVIVTPGWDYVLRHTACPAIMVGLEAPVTAAVENRVTQPAWQDAVARALFRGTVAMLQPDAEAAAVGDLLAALGDRAPARDRLDLVRLDGNFSWLPPSGQVAGVAVPSWSADDPGLPVLGDRHLLELRAGAQWQLWAMDRLPRGGEHGSGLGDGRLHWTGRLLLENR